MLEWLKEHWGIVCTCVAVIAIIAIVIIVAVNGGNVEFDVIGWNTNPANPASPIHNNLY